MRIRQIATKDFMDAVRGRRLHFLVILFGLLGVLIGYVLDNDAGKAIFVLLGFLGPLVGLGFTQHSVAGKRESHELAVLLSLPFSRRDVIAGTFAGRTGVLVAGLVSVYATMISVSLLTGGTLDWGVIVAGFAFLTVISVVFVSIALGISAATRSTTVASAGIFVSYLVFVLQVWQLIPEGVLFLRNGLESTGGNPTWASVFDQLSPFAAVRNTMMPVASSLAESFPVAAGSVPADPPVYMEPWFGTIVLAVWLVAPVALGYLRFQRSDL